MSLEAMGNAYLIEALEKRMKRLEILVIVLALFTSMIGAGAFLAACGGDAPPPGDSTPLPIERTETTFTTTSPMRGGDFELLPIESAEGRLIPDPPPE